MQHHLRRWRCGLRPGRGRLIGRGQVEGGLVAGEVADRDGAAYVEGLGGAEEQLVVGVGGDRLVEVEGIGEVEVALDVHGPGHRDLVQGDVEVADLGRRGPLGLGLLGVEPGDGLLDQPAQLRRADRVRERGDVWRPRRPRPAGERAQGAVGDEPQPPRRQLAGLEPGPAAGQPVAALHRLGQVAAAGLGGAAQRGSELDDRELRDLRAALPTQRQAALVPLVDRPHQGLARVHRGPPRRGLHDLAGRVVLGRLLGPRERQHSGGVVCLLRAAAGRVVEVIVGPTQPPATDIDRTGSPLCTRDPGHPGCAQELDFEGQSGAVAAGISKARAAGGAPASTSGGLRILDHRGTAARPPAATR